GPGVAPAAPCVRPRGLLEFCGMVCRGEPLESPAKHSSPPSPGGTGLGKPLHLINKPVRERIPIVVAALGPKNVALAAEIADGWQPIFYFPEKAPIAWQAPLEEGAAKRPAELGELDVIAAAPLAVGDGEDIPGLRDLMRPMFALYIGGMGARERNFYNDLAVRFGYEKEARAIQDAYLAGRKDEAAALVPAEMLAKTS